MRRLLGVEPAFPNTGGAALKFRPRPDVSCGRLRRSSLVSAVNVYPAFADDAFPPRLNLRFWRPPSAAAACSLREPTNPGVRAVVYSIKVGAPGFEPGTSASRTQRSTGLSHAPKFTYHRPKTRSRGEREGWLLQADGMGLSSGRLRRSSLVSAVSTLGRIADHTPGASARTNPTPTCAHYINGWGGIRTHEGINPHDFQSCALSRSATHPDFRPNGGLRPHVTLAIW